LLLLREMEEVRRGWLEGEHDTTVTAQGHRQYGAVLRHRAGSTSPARHLGLRGALPGLENQGQPHYGGAQGKVIITCAVTGSIHSRACRRICRYARRDRRRRDRRGAGRRGDRAPARGQSQGWQPDAGSRAVQAVLPKIKPPRTWSSPDHRRRADHEHRERCKPALRPEARVASLKHGLDETSACTRCSAATRSSSTTGKALTSRAATSASSRTASRYRLHPAVLRRQRHRFEIECYDNRPSLHRGALPGRRLLKPPLFIQSVFGIRGGIARIRERAAHEANCPTACSATLTTGRCWAPAANQMFIARCRRYGRQCPRRPRGQPVARPRAARRVERRAGLEARRILEELGFAVASPNDAREMLKLKGARHVLLGCSFFCFFRSRLLRRTGPPRLVKFVSPYPPGARRSAGAHLAAKLAESLKQQFIVENRTALPASSARTTSRRARPTAIRSCSSSIRMRCTRRSIRSCPSTRKGFRAVMLVAPAMAITTAPGKPYRSFADVSRPRKRGPTR